MHKLITLPDKEDIIRLFGPRDSFLRQLREAFDVKVVARGEGLSLEGPDSEVETCEQVLNEMQEHLGRRESLTTSLVSQIIESRKESGPRRGETRIHLEGFSERRIVRAKTPGQERYVQAILENDIVFCIGPAGTGKTYLAVAVALDYMKRGELSRMVLCRPAVEAGEHLGFLPGDLRAKVNPYLRPLYDALHDMMGPAQVRRYVESDLIEILPMAFVRGRTLDNAFIILDEAQNCTVAQMKTFLTRLGQTARLVVTGDITQVDLPQEHVSGLVDVQGRLASIKGIKFVRLTVRDIVRHRLVRDIVTAYQKETAPEAEAKQNPGQGQPDEDNSDA